jgi:hypothetical protein
MQGLLDVPSFLFALYKRMVIHTPAQIIEHIRYTPMHIEPNKEGPVDLDLRHNTYTDQQERWKQLFEAYLNGQGCFLPAPKTSNSAQQQTVSSEQQIKDMYGDLTDEDLQMNPTSVRAEMFVCSISASLYLPVYPSSSAVGQFQVR